MLALYVYTPLSLAGALVISGEVKEAREFYAAAADLAPNRGFADSIWLEEAENTGDLKALPDPDLPITAKHRAALIVAQQALTSTEAGAKAQAVRALLALPQDDQDEIVARLLADLGAPHDAFQITRRLLIERRASPAFLWDPRMRPVLDDPGLPPTMKVVGLLDYWRKSDSKPDVCIGSRPPLLCSAI